VRLKVLAKPRRLVALSVDVEEDAVSVVIVVVAAAVVRVDVDVDVEGPPGHLALFVSSLVLRIPTNLQAF